MQQDNPGPAFLRLEQAIARLERLAQAIPPASPRAQPVDDALREELAALKQRHLLLRARTHAAVEGIDALLKDSL